MVQDGRARAVRPTDSPESAALPAPRTVYTSERIPGDGAILTYPDNFDRGTLNTNNPPTGIATLAYAKDWTHDRVDNWSPFQIDAKGDGSYQTFSSNDLEHPRADDAANAPPTLTANFGAAWVSPAYDLNGKMADMSIPAPPGNETVCTLADRNGYLLDAARSLLASDFRLLDPVTYRYNGLNFRVQKLLGSNPSSPTSYYDYYYNENWQVLEERKGGSTNPYAQYVWDARYIDAPVVRFNPPTPARRRPRKSKLPSPSDLPAG